MANPFTPAPQVEGLSGIDGTNKDRIVQVGALQVGNLMCLTPDNCASAIFEVDANLRYDEFEIEINRVGPYFAIYIGFGDLIMDVTDGAGSGSYGNLRVGEWVGDDVCIQQARLFLEGIGENGAATFDGDTTDQSAVITNIANVVGGIQVGATVTGVGIGVGARIVSFDSDTLQATLDVVSTVTDTAVSLTQPAVSGGDTAFEIGLGSESIDAASDGDIGALGDDTAEYALISVADLGAFTEESDSNPIARFTDDTGLYINWSGSAATVDASGSIELTGYIRLIGVLLALD
jgi:hypothetical protein